MVLKLSLVGKGQHFKVSHAVDILVDLSFSQIVMTQQVPFFHFDSGWFAPRDENRKSIKIIQLLFSFHIMEDICFR